jgi:ribosomal-protein-alanine N-acetyltransferase
MTEHDLLEVIEIEETSDLSRWGWDAYFTELKRVDETIMRVARRSAADERGDLFRPEVLGFIATRVVAGELHINNVAVRRSERRQGIGAALLGEALEAGRSKGARRAILEVRASNNDAQMLYRRHGFSVAGRRRNYYTAPVGDALVMIVEL